MLVGTFVCVYCVFVCTAHIIRFQIYPNIMWISISLVLMITKIFRIILMEMPSSICLRHSLGKITFSSSLHQHSFLVWILLVHLFQSVGTWSKEMGNYWPVYSIMDLFIGRSLDVMMSMQLWRYVRCLILHTSLLLNRND